MVNDQDHAPQPNKFFLCYKSTNDSHYELNITDPNTATIQIA